ncbi:MAG: class I SAM-dependent methyltransferase [Bacteroidales bacterium]|jgi:2-polyprenyl-3-methyl-5-hydroxy-6-metoxy-1,4-benzoquinol methylase|nr:class I SAM-dependent methyltransferase [Bacteroidales bacterium]
MFVLIPFRHKKISQNINVEMNLYLLSILDVGCGTHSSTLAKKWLQKPNLVIHYSGIDLDLNYVNNETDRQNMDVFYPMDVTKLDFEQIPNQQFDVIVMSHIIEHLYNAEEVIIHLLPKLKSKGLLYLEFPNERSMTLPSMKGTLNFFDDPTHTRIHSKRELCNLLLSHNCTIKAVGRRRQWSRILFLPFIAAHQLLTVGSIQGGAFWDLFGFSDYVLAKKK